ncbi:hypothetical protein PYW08_012947 [Mythimna loreyi]|uniref:Uncharacterized protein n=1 Tax=Mythimna loreyi TaxID=667449 RepID=A0ACC2Q1E4_9NEOP|nr:hypothetical protein PYW08_012947 [Mythimna loreyi]
MCNHAVDIMAINETWLRKGEEDRAPSVPGYRLKHLPRPVSVRGGRGGGVAFNIRDGVAARVRVHPAHDEVEQLWLGLTVNKKKLLIGTAYRPPWLNLEIFIEGLTASMCGLAPYDHVILLGYMSLSMGDKNKNHIPPHDMEGRQDDGYLTCKVGSARSPASLQTIPTVEDQTHCQ